MRKLSEGKISSNILYMTIPILITQILQSVYNLTDMFFVGRLGPEAIASVSMSGILVGIIITFAVGISVGTLSLVSRYIGAGKKKDAEEIIIQSIFLSILSYIIVFVFALFFIKPTFELMGANQEVTMLGIEYIRIILFGSIFIFISVLMNSSLRASGDSITPTKIMMLSTFINIVLDPILIYGLLGFPKLGVEGAAIATVFSRLISSVIVVYILFSGKHFLKLKLSDVIPNFSRMFEILKIGIFASLSMIMRNISSLVLMKIVAVFGTVAIAAYGVGMRIIMVLLSAGFAIGKGTATVVGQSFGAGKKDRARETVHVSIKMFSLIIISISLLIIFFSKWVMMLFTSNSQVISIGQQYLLYTLPFLIFAIVSIISSNSLGALGETFRPMIITFIALFIIQIPLAVFLKNPLGLIGVWVSIDVAQFFQGVFNFILFERAFSNPRILKKRTAMKSFRFNGSGEI